MRSCLVVKRYGRGFATNDRGLALRWLIPEVNSATRCPSRLAVSRSPFRGASSGDAWLGEIAMAPAYPPVQLMSLGPSPQMVLGMHTETNPHLPMLLGQGPKVCNRVPFVAIY